jgi:hypothetical protein
VEVPPVPTRKLAVAALLLGVLVAVGAALLVPALDSSKARHRRAEAAAQRAIVRAEERRLRADQRLHTLRVDDASFPDLVARLEHAITADARARVAAHRLAGPVVRTTCTSSSPETAVYPDSRVYTCMVLAPASNGATSGYPFIATIFARRRELAWCKENPSPGEGSSFHQLARVRLSDRCAGNLAATIVGEP